MITILYSPHMTSVDNEAKCASGHADVPLSSAGQQQAQELGRHYPAQSLDAVFCSDLLRAATTAQIAFAHCQVPIMPDARLREYDYGDFTQYPVAEVEQQFPLRIKDPFPHGESLVMVVERIGAFLRDVLRDYDGKTIVIIGHRATRYGLEYWCSDHTLEAIVGAPWEWREVPIWRYELHAQNLNKLTLDDTATKGS